MTDDFPPLPFLQAFAKAAETSSFKEAADALHVSPSALTRRIQSLEAQLGVALCAKFLCATRVANGRLCIPFDLPLASESTYHLVCRPEGLDDPRIVALRDWLVDSLS